MGYSQEWVCPAPAPPNFFKKADLAFVLNALADYCNVLYLKLTLKTVQKPQVVQNAVVKIQSDHTAPVFYLH